MKKICSILLLCLSTLLCSHAIALTPPKPIKGTPGINAKSLNLNGYAFELPGGWGVGEMNRTDDSQFFQLYPTQGGVGCSVEISKFDNAVLANKALKRKLKTFSTDAKQITLEDGFEIELPKAYYSCRVNGEYLIQMWYSLPEKTNKKYSKNWKLLKNLSIAVPRDIPSIDVEPKFLSVERTIFGTWIFNHPNIACG
jgi:hypothetical protein